MKLSIEIKGKKYEVEINESEAESGTFNVMVDGEEFLARIKGNSGNPAANPVGREPSGARKISTGVSVARAAGVGNAITAPMPGSIVAVHASEGDTVNRGKEVITMETMKMNVPIFAPRDGKLKSIKVGIGDSVKAAQILAEYDT